MRALVRCVLAALCVASFAACKNKEKEQRRTELRALMHGTTADRDIQAAMAKARATLPEFLKILQKPAANQRQFMLRAIFPAKDAPQQILWVTDLTYDGTLLHGKVDDNTAKPGSGIGPDGKVSVPADRVADWMYNEDGKAVGGYMLRALKAKMTPEEWAPFEEKFTFKD
jgi:uncharacterized protein YegJ (DUF2314 family)